MKKRAILWSIVVFMVIDQGSGEYYCPLLDVDCVRYIQTSTVGCIQSVDWTGGLDYWTGLLD